MSFVWIWEQTAIISLYSINWLIFITETESVHCTVRTECVLCGSQNKDGLFPYTALTDWFLWTRWGVYCAVRTGSLNIDQIYLAPRGLKHTPSQRIMKRHTANGTHRIFRSSPCRAQQLYRIESLHQPSHPVTAALPRKTMKETHSIIAITLHTIRCITMINNITDNWNLRIQNQDTLWQSRVVLTYVRRTEIPTAGVAGRQRPAGGQKWAGKHLDSRQVASLLLPDCTLGGCHKGLWRARPGH
jgi:hypothetical protein